MRQSIKIHNKNHVTENALIDTNSIADDYAVVIDESAPFIDNVGTVTANTFGPSEVPSVENETVYEYETEESYDDKVNHPDYYNNYDIEAIEMLRRIFGDKEVSIWSKINAMKYRLRMGLKPGNDVNQDLAKEKWYLNKYRELKED